MLWNELPGEPLTKQQIHRHVASRDRVVDVFVPQSDTARSPRGTPTVTALLVFTGEHLLHLVFDRNSETWGRAELYHDEQATKRLKQLAAASSGASLVRYRDLETPGAEYHPEFDDRLPGVSPQKAHDAQQRAEADRQAIAFESFTYFERVSETVRAVSAFVDDDPDLFDRAFAEAVSDAVEGCLDALMQAVRDAAKALVDSLAGLSTHGLRHDSYHAVDAVAFQAGLSDEVPEREWREGVERMRDVTGDDLGDPGEFRAALFDPPDIEGDLGVPSFARGSPVSEYAGATPSFSTSLDTRTADAARDLTVTVEGNAFRSYFDAADHDDLRDALRLSNGSVVHYSSSTHRGGL